jgi:microfibrillar-associated protein 1
MERGEEEEEEGFAIRRMDATTRRKAEARVLVRREDTDEDDRRQRRRRSSSSDSKSSNASTSSSSSSSSSSDESSRRRGRGRRGGNRASEEARESDSSSSSEDEVDMRRRRAREQRATREENQRCNGETVDAAVAESDGERMNIHREEERRGRAKATDEGGMDEGERGIGKTPRYDKVVLPSHVNDKNGRNRRAASRGSSTSSRTSSSSSSTSSSSTSDDSSSSSDESDERPNAAVTPALASRPVFVPKSKRGTVAEVEMRQKRVEDAEERRQAEAEKRAIQSRALVAEIASSAASGGRANNDGSNEGDEFDTGESGGEYIPVPDDADPDDPDLLAAERDAWEVRELLRLLRDVDVAEEREKERLELVRRRGLTDEERLAEDRSSGRYRAPGEARRRAAAVGGRTNGDGGEGGGHYLQRFHHRGAFYMDEDTLNRAGPDDVRHRAAEYSRAATGEDKIDKSALPEVMQVKKFGFAGYSTKYKGLAKEDTTDRKMDFLPILRGREGGGAASRGRGGGYGNSNGVDGRGGDRRRYG